MKLSRNKVLSAVLVTAGSIAMSNIAQAADALGQHVRLLHDRGDFSVGRLGSRPYVVVDTGGISHDRDDVDLLMQQQVQQAIGEADRVVFIVDARDGLTAADETIAAGLRRSGKPVTLAVNKTEGLDYDSISGDFFSLGIGLGQGLRIGGFGHGKGMRKERRE